MLFNSFSFLLFFIAFFILYWFVTNSKLKIQNVLLLMASYFFYACWDWRFLFLLMFSTLLDYLTGLKMQDAENQKGKRFWFWLSVVINLGFLGVFKYFDFFATSFAELMLRFGVQVSPWMLKLILPVGISFYTFHGLSYVIDIYNGKIKAERNFINYAVFVCFFPLLVAGPIERATHLLPQIVKPRVFNAEQGMKGFNLIVLGLFKKIVVADTCALFVNHIWQDYASISGLTLCIGTVLFAFQIYCDFSGYTDIAIGCAKLLGFELVTNFKTPYFSKSIGEFWQRWHISLSSWFRDYVYIPLGGSREGKMKTLRNVLIIFLLSGFWHGANWTFMVWGLINAIFFLPGLFYKPQSENENLSYGFKVKNVVSVMFTFSIVCLGWIFFRSNSIQEAVLYLGRCFEGGLSVDFFLRTNTYKISSVIAVFSILQLLMMEYFYANRPTMKGKSVADQFGSVICALLMFEVIFMGSYKNHFDFIYFQF